MMGQAATVFVVGPLAQKIEHLRKCKGHDKVIGTVRIAYQEEQGRFLVPELIKLQLVITHNLPELRYIKRSKPCAAGNQYAFGGFAAGQLVFGILAHSEVLGTSLGKAVKHIVHSVFEALVILPDFHAVYHFHQRVHVPFFLRPLKDDIGHKSTVQKGFRFRPELVTFFAVSFGIGNQGVDELQNIAFRLDIGHGVVVHGF